jgi:caffeoyl-CoA O-methyltransferase
MNKVLDLLPELRDYTTSRSTPPDELVTELVERTRTRFPRVAGMQVSPEQATLFGMLARLVGARRAVEVGTFTGLSSLSFARAMPPDGQLICLDISTEFTAVAREFWAKAGVEDRVDLRIGPALDGLRALPAEPHLDLAFIDADKGNYSAYWAEIVPRMRPGGLVIVDNVLWKGAVLSDDVDPGDVDTNALKAFNDEVARDERVDVIMLIFGDGLTLARRR